MQVKCINKKGWRYADIYEKKKWPWSKKKLKDADGPKYGDIVTVQEEYVADNEKYYVLAEWPNNGRGYIARAFAPIDEGYKEVTFSALKKDVPVPSEN